MSDSHNIQSHDEGTMNPSFCCQSQSFLSNLLIMQIGWKAIQDAAILLSECFLKNENRRVRGKWGEEEVRNVQQSKVNGKAESHCIRTCALSSIFVRQWYESASTFPNKSRSIVCITFPLETSFSDAPVAWEISMSSSTLGRQRSDTIFTCDSPGLVVNAKWDPHYSKSRYVHASFDYETIKLHLSLGLETINKHLHCWKGEYAPNPMNL